MNSMLYSRKFSRGKTLQIGEKYDFRGENFRRLLVFSMPKDVMPQNFAEKTFANTHKTLKFVKVFSLENFPLYSSYLFCMSAMLSCMHCPID